MLTPRRCLVAAIPGLCALTAAATVVAFSTPAWAAPSVPATTSGAKPVTRLSGGDRIGTAIAISQNTFPTAGGAKAVVLTASYDFPDALSGGPLGADVTGPVLLTQPGQLSTETETEIKRVAPAGATVYVLGGYGAIAKAVDDQLTADGFVPKRIAGDNRYSTSVAIAKAEGSPSTVLLATGRIFADALSAGPAAVSVHGAVLLTDGPNLPPDVAAYLTSLTNPTVDAIGSGAAKAYPQATPFFGGDRFATSALVAQKFFTNPTVVGLATGWDFPDALAGAAAMGTKGGPVLLTDPHVLPSAIGLYLAENQNAIGQAFLFGGEGALSDKLAAQVSHLINNQP